jgi:hypothetical protein
MISLLLMIIKPLFMMDAFGDVKFFEAATDVYDPKTIEERRAVAGQCEEALKYGIRTYVDEMDDGMNKTYAAWPTRLYLVGLDGNVAYAGGLGPFGFKPAELGAAIEAYLGREVTVQPF